MDGIWQRALVVGQGEGSDHRAVDGRLASMIVAPSVLRCSLCVICHPMIAKAKQHTSTCMMFVGRLACICVCMGCDVLACGVHGHVMCLYGHVM